MTIQKNGTLIRTVEEWRQLAPPQRENQWQLGRSAMTAAECWTAVSSPVLPVGIGEMLEAHPAFGRVLQWEGEPEVPLSFDRRRGPRMTDLLVRARDANGPFILAVECKVNETYGETVAEALADSLERRVANERSEGIGRVVDLASSMFRNAEKGSRSFRALRYQLLTATAGAIAAALSSQVPRVVLLVQEFGTSKAKAAQQEENARDLDAFIHRLSDGLFTSCRCGTIVGPFDMIPGTPLFQGLPQLYIGKVREVRATD
jgi:hypothetical protein